MMKKQQIEVGDVVMYEDKPLNHSGCQDLDGNLGYVWSIRGNEVLVYLFPNLNAIPYWVPYESLHLISKGDFK